MSKTEKAIEILRCAEVNCGNAMKNPVFAQIVKAQIQEAIVALDGEMVTADVLASYRNDPPTDTTGS